MIMEACPRQLFVLKALLNTFSESTGLKVNYSKSSMVPINISADRLDHLASTFQCKAGKFPFTYLGLPMGIHKPSVLDCLPLVERIERRLVSTSILTSQGSKLQLVNSVLSSLPTFYMYSIKIPVEILNQIDKYRRHCLWRGSDLNARKPPLAAWKSVTRPKRKGGLGVIRLRVHNDALLMKHLHKFFSKDGLPWVQLVWVNTIAMANCQGKQKKALSGGEVFLNCRTFIKDYHMLAVGQGIPFLSGRTYGMGTSFIRPTLICIHSPRINRSLFRLYYIWNLWMIIFSCLCLWRLTMNSVNRIFSYNLFRGLLEKTLDHIFGIVMTTLRQKHINTSWVAIRYTHPLGGYGQHLVSRGTRFSFG
jgi:hypothetical protein